MINIYFEYYVLNYNHNKHKIEPFNIFNNIHVHEYTEKLVKKYLRNPKKFTYKSYNSEEVMYGFDAFVKELDNIIKWQEWSRCEYEIGVGYAFEDDCNKLEKWDCYGQVHMNIELIARDIIYQYKQHIKNKEDDK